MTFEEFLAFEDQAEIKHEFVVGAPRPCGVLAAASASSTTAARGPSRPVTAHSGEADPAVTRFRTLSPDDREALLSFLSGL